MKAILWLSNKIGIGIDKLLHFGVSFVITFVLSFINILFAIVLTSIIGLYKEFIDSHKINNYWSWKDLIADGIGVVVAILTHIIFI